MSHLFVFFWGGGEKQIKLILLILDHDTHYEASGVIWFVCVKVRIEGKAQRAMMEVKINSTL